MSSVVQEAKKKIIDNKIASLKEKVKDDQPKAKKVKTEVEGEFEDSDDEVLAKRVEKNNRCTDHNYEDTSKRQEVETAKDLFAVFKPDDEDGSESDEHFEEAEDSNANDAKPSLKGSPQRKKYKKEWEEVPIFKNWLSASVHGNTYFYCKFCKKDYRCGKSELVKHMNSKKHQTISTKPVTKVEKKFSFRGLLCPAFTFFENTRTRDVNFSAIKQYGAFLKSSGVHGILINDILGEGMSLTMQERMLLTDSWSDVCAKTGQFLMVQVGGAPFPDVIEMVKHAEKKKVGAIVVLPDLYGRPKDHLDVIKYLKLVSEVSKDLPILYHHCPAYFNFDMDVGKFLVDLTGEMENFVGVIISTNDLQQGMTALTINESKYTVFLSSDEIIVGAVASGFTCIMANSLNFFAKLVQSVCSSVQKGEYKTAQHSQKILKKCVDRIKCHGDVVSTYKAAMSVLTPLSAYYGTRPPLDTVWEGIIKKMTNDLRELGVV